jgi:type IV pilus assembly protein PilZ
MGGCVANETKGGADSRAQARLPIELKVDYKKMNSFFADYTKNISKDGTFIKTKKPLAIGTQFLFKLSVPRRESAFELLGEVVWARSEGDEPGMGIRFVYSDESVRKEFESVVEKMMSETLGTQISAKLLSREGKDA